MNFVSDKSYKLLQRMVIMFSLMLLCFLAIIIRLFYLQIIQADKYTKLSDKNRVALRMLAPSRGIIFDRNGVEIANNEQAFKAVIVAEQSPDVRGTLRKVDRILNLSENEKLNVINKLKKSRRFVPVKIKDFLSWEDVSAIELKIAELQGILIDESFIRNYPYNDYFAHVIGYVSAVSDKDKKNDPLLQMSDFKIGKSGVEQLYESDLRGKSGNLTLEVNALGRAMRNIDRQDPQNGKNIYLSIDSRLQKKAYELFGEQSGALVVMNVHTGEILAYASVPSFNPNIFVEGIDYNEWKDLLSNPKNPLVDKVSAGVYSPGSTFKMMTALAGLKSGVINMSTKVNCTGKFELGGQYFHCWKHSGHGPLTVVEALEHSCDVFFYDLALKVGIDEIASVAREFGLGENTDIGFLIEKNGIIPDKKWKMQRFGEKWQKGESVIAAIGQGYVGVTPLQLAVMVTRIANGKEKVKPTLLKTTSVPKFENLNISPSNIDIVKNGMYQVVNGEGGTAKGAYFNINGAKLAGKTGTTQVRRISMSERKKGIINDKDLPWNLRNHALFVGFAPYDNPQYAVAVVVEHGSSGSGVAAPIASQILQEAILLNSAE